MKPDKPYKKGFDDLVAVLKTDLQPKLLVIAERFKLH